MAEQSPAPRPLPEEGWAPLSGQVILRISGPQTDAFLNGQLSQNLADVSEYFSPRAAGSSPKGRAYLLTRLVREGEDVLFNVSAGLAERTTTHLNKYLMLFRGTDMTRADDIQMVGLLGEAIATGLLGPGSGDTLPAHPGDTRLVPAGHLVRTEPTGEGLARFELWLTGGQRPTDVLDPAQAINESAWAASEIEAGVPHLSEQTLEAYVPQMLNWQHLTGVHFRKGCYTGQEVIARMHFLGQLKKSLYRLSVTGPAPAVGDAIQFGERSVGEVVNAIMRSDGTAECLAVMRHDAASQPLTLADGERGLTLMMLPYAVPEREKSEAPDT